jgi:ribosomal protein S18 acetylase RimI-like enzyme
MPPDIRPVPPGEDAAPLILAAIFDEARRLGLPFDPEPLAFEVREDGRWLGGLSGRITQGWLYIELLGVAPEARGRGIGRRLMAEAEHAARERGCEGIFLDTYSFQAPAFYARLGFTEFGRIPGYPPGHARIFLARRLDGRPLAAGDGGA